MLDDDLHRANAQRTLSPSSHGQVFVVTSDAQLLATVTPCLEDVGFSVEHLPDDDVRRALYSQALVLDFRGHKAMHQRSRSLVELLATFRVRPCAVAVIDQHDGLAFAVQHGIGVVGSDVVQTEIAEVTERAVRDLRRPRLF
ncbi:MAG: hypothetical protein ACXVEF_41775 [Polyangiales bacterium]